MKKIKIYFMLSILICLAFFRSCILIDDDIPKQIKIDNIVTVNFPDGSITSPNPTVEKLSDTDIKSIFDETVILFEVTNSISYQVKISLGNQPPDNDEIEVILNLPDDFLAQKPQTNSIELFALTYQDGGEEILDNFELISSTYNSTNKTVTSKLPLWIFSDARNGNYETVLIIASIPGENYKKSPKTGNQTTENCLASQIICPIGTCNITSSYQKGRLDPLGSGKKKTHLANDFSSPQGTNIFAVADGDVIYTKINTTPDKSSRTGFRGFGLYMIIRHKDGSSTLYAHLSQILISQGPVKKGDIIAKSGGSPSDKPNAGGSTGPHLHFEYVPNGKILQSKKRIDPFPCITPASLASITTVSATNITENSATSGGNITNDGNGAITTRGVCWSTSQNPTINNSKTSDGTRTGSFTSSISGLSSNTTYYVRAYATNIVGTAYGSQISFTTLNSVNLNLDGDWDNGGTQVRITGSFGIFIKFASGSNWSLASSLGFVWIGSYKLKNLSKTSTRSWTCSELWWHKTNGILDQVAWSPIGTLQMSADGNSFTTYTTNPWDGSLGSATFIRVGKKSMQLSKTSQENYKIQGVD